MYKILYGRSLTESNYFNSQNSARATSLAFSLLPFTAHNWSTKIRYVVEVFVRACFYIINFFYWFQVKEGRF
ncbi:hypothetical protein RCL_jg19776.t1 [Rhizophagus clarus]|uniref:Uncharacterized protein n=1 Tax=Rhizophagus clarus TaxID=94130 RepID=A0A8H3M5B3_9GLOM|nr:hypothetical protein RCL_jg19776.t1 [Rhizophagus clarus]